MPEILTESFCERCGTRYTFESVAPRKTRRLGQFKTLSKGVRNWVMSDDSSLDEALAAARSDEEREVTAHQLDAFHSTFNFCMNCRQYTCANCWNPVEGRCLTCAPNLGQEILQAPFPNSAGFEPVRIDAEAWPEADFTGNGSAGSATLDVAGLPGDAGGNGFHEDELVPSANGAPEEPLPDIDAAARLAFLAGRSEPEVAGEPVGASAEPEDGSAASATPDSSSTDLAWPDEATAEPDLISAATEVETPVAAAAPSAETDTAPQGAVAAEDVAVDDTDQRAAELASRTSTLLGRFRPGQSLDAEIAAYEARLEAEEAAVAAEAGAPKAEPELADAGLAASAGTTTSEPVAEPQLAEPGRVAEVAAISPAADAEAEPAAAEAQAEAQPVAAAPLPAAPTPAATEPEPAPAAASAEQVPSGPPTRDDVVEQPTWRIFAPDQTSVPSPIVPGPGAPAGTSIQASAEPQWPVTPDLEQSPSMALFANRDRISSDALWAASAREVLGGPLGPTPAPTPAVQPCSNCGLSLSANARFCRRCGTRQA